MTVGAGSKKARGNHRVHLEEGVIHRGGGSGRGDKEGKIGLVEDDVTRDEDFMGREVKASICLVIRRASKEDATSGAGHKLVRGSDREIRITSAPKHAKVNVGGRGGKESKAGVG